MVESSHCEGSAGCQLSLEVCSGCVQAVAPQLVAERLQLIGPLGGEVSAQPLGVGGVEAGQRVLLGNGLQNASTSSVQQCAGVT